MKLLFDENVSHRLVASLADDFPGSQHFRDAGLVGASDERIWEFARTGGFSIVSKDNDFRQRSFVAGPPPKVVWLEVGNDGTAAIAALIRRSRQSLLRFAEDPDTALLILSSLRATP